MPISSFRSRLARLAAFILLAALPISIPAWQLQQKPLAARVDAASLIVVGSVAVIHSRSRSLIMGTGDEWDVTLRVTRVLKGSPPKTLRVSFSEVAVEDWRSFKPERERIWLLSATPNGRIFAAPAGYTSVLLLSEEQGIRDSLREGANTAGASATRAPTR